MIKNSIWLKFLKVKNIRIVLTAKATQLQNELKQKKDEIEKKFLIQICLMKDRQ